MQAMGALDHVVILVKDLDDSDRRLERLGFRPTPRGLHSAHMGTGNATVVMPDRLTYLETVGVVSPTPANVAQRNRLAEREGLYGLAFKSSDAKATAAAFAAAGVSGGPAVEFSRAVELPSGTAQAAFTVARGDPAATPGAWCFVCQHHTPEVVWREDCLAQPNGALAVAEIVGVFDPPFPEAALRGWRAMFGQRLTVEPDSVRIASDTAPITFLARQQFEQRFHPYGKRITGTAPLLAALCFRSDDPVRARNWLLDQGVPNATTVKGEILVPPEEACGVLVAFVPTA